MTRSSGTGARALRVALAVLAIGAPAEAQLPDAFFGHFGAIRTREVGVSWSASFGAMLLSQYGSSWDGAPNVWTGPQDFTNYDQLVSSVGYNYLSGGAQWGWPSGAWTLVLEGSATLGVTSDVLTEWFQDGVHSFRRLAHVYRVPEESGDGLFGAELTGSLWHSWYSASFDVHLYPTLGLIAATYHREVYGGVGVGLRVWVLKLQAEGTAASLYGRSSIEPASVGARLEPSYVRAQVALTIERTQVGALQTVIPLPGVGLTWSSGIFPNEREFLISIFLEIPSFIGNHTWRIEHVNDFVNETPNGFKDHGPTGGLRFTYVAR